MKADLLHELGILDVDFLDLGGQHDGGLQHRGRVRLQQAAAEVETAKNSERGELFRELGRLGGF